MLVSIDFKTEQQHTKYFYDITDIEYSSHSNEIRLIEDVCTTLISLSKVKRISIEEGDGEQ